MKNYPILSIDQLRQLKRELKTLIDSNDDWVVDSYFKGYDKFMQHIENLNNRQLSTLKIEEIRLIYFINKLSIYDIEFMMKEL